MFALFHKLYPLHKARGKNLSTFPHAIKNLFVYTNNYQLIEKNKV